MAHLTRDYIIKRRDQKPPLLKESDWDGEEIMTQDQIQQRKNFLARQFEELLRKQA